MPQNDAISAADDPDSRSASPVSRRADAERNRNRLLTAAATAFTAAGDDGDVTLEAIARTAGVGIGTLYRHFPTREALVEAVYENELCVLCASATDLLSENPPEQALRAWIARYDDFVTTKRGMADALRAAISSGAITSVETRRQLDGAIGAILEAGAASGTLRADVPPGDVSASLAGILLATREPGLADQRRRMLDLLADALAPRVS